MTGNSIILASGEAVERGARRRQDEKILREGRRRRKERGTRGRKNERKRRPRLRVLRLRSYDLRLKGTSLGRSGTRCLRNRGLIKRLTSNITVNREYGTRACGLSDIIFAVLFSRLREIVRRIMIRDISDEILKNYLKRVDRSPWNKFLSLLFSGISREGPYSLWYHRINGTS